MKIVIMNFLRMELLIIITLLTISGAQQSHMEGPENTLRVVDSNVTLKCSSSSRNCTGIDWLKYIPGASPTTIFKGPEAMHGGADKARYSVDNSYGCDLVIRNVQLKDSGRFICSAIVSLDQITKSANLIILEAQPKCALNVSVNDTVEGEGVQLKCEVTYNGTNSATMNWKGVTHAPAVVVMNYTAMILVYSVVGFGLEVPSFTCEASFAVETSDKGTPIRGLATNSIPSSNCSTSAIKVLYSVRNVTLSPSLSNYPPGTVISCAAKGHPSPTLKWQEQENNGAWVDIQNQNGSQFSVNDSRCSRYRCIAVNVIRGRIHNETSQEFQIYSMLGAAGNQSLKGPENTLSVVGSAVTLKCSSPSRNCIGIDWMKYIPTDNAITIFSTRQGINDAYKDRYRVDTSSGCDLVIRNVGMRDAGRFICRAFISSNTVEKAAHLIISEIKQPICTIHESLDNIFEGSRVRLTCEVTHNGKLNVSISWKGVEDAPVTVENGETTSRSCYVVASAPVVPSFACIASFAVVADNVAPFRCLATNIPNATCATSVTDVLYSVRNVALSPSLSRYSPGSVINCTAKGHPSPTCKWQEMEHGSTWKDIQNHTGCKFTTPSVSSKWYRCVAMNVVWGESYSATSHEFMVNNIEIGNNANYTVTTMVSAAVGVVGLSLLGAAVGAAVGFLLLIILLIVCFCVRVCPGHKCCHSGNKSNEKISKDEHPLRENPVFSCNKDQVRDQDPAYASLELQVLDQESAYESLEIDRVATEYMSLESKTESKVCEQDQTLGST